MSLVVATEASTFSEGAPTASAKKVPAKRNDPAPNISVFFKVKISFFILRLNPKVYKNIVAIVYIVDFDIASRIGGICAKVFRRIAYLKLISIPRGFA